MTTEAAEIVSHIILMPDYAREELERLLDTHRETKDVREQKRLELRMEQILDGDYGV